MDIQAQALTETFAWRGAPEAQFAVIAEDASHSLSPLMHSAAFQAVGIGSRYVALNVPVGEVGHALEHLRERGYIGVNVTLPHKAEARDWVATFETSYSEVQVANTIRLEDRAGFNTDTIGFARSIEKYGLSSGDQVLVLGAGGSALAVVAVLARLVGEVRVWNRTAERAKELVAKFKNRVTWMESPSPAGCRMVVNATSAGKYGEAPPLRWEETEYRSIAYDLFYARNSTPFLRVAAERKMITQDGVELLIYQGAAAWPLWRIQQDSPIHQMEKVVREALAVRS